MPAPLKTEHQIPRAYWNACAKRRAGRRASSRTSRGDVPRLQVLGQDAGLERAACLKQCSSTEGTMPKSISTLLIRNLGDVFGENDPARRCAAIEALYTEGVVFYGPKGTYRGRDEIDRIAGVIKATHPDFRPGALRITEVHLHIRGYREVLVLGQLQSAVPSTKSRTVFCKRRPIVWTFQLWRWARTCVANCMSRALFVHVAWEAIA